ncbi:MAG: TIGR04563 family protein [Myxococcales bacterium]
MAGNENRKQSLYFPLEMLAEIQREANRQDRSLSWVVQQAWRLAREEIRRLPSVNDPLEAALRPERHREG